MLTRFNLENNRQQPKSQNQLQILKRKEKKNSKRGKREKMRYLMDGRIHRICTNRAFKKLMDTCSFINHTTIEIIGVGIIVRRLWRRKLRKGMGLRDLLFIHPINERYAFNARFHSWIFFSNLFLSKSIVGHFRRLRDLEMRKINLAEFGWISRKIPIFSRDRKVKQREERIYFLGVWLSSLSPYWISEGAFLDALVMRENL